MVMGQVISDNCVATTWRSMDFEGKCRVPREMENSRKSTDLFLSDGGLKQFIILIKLRRCTNRIVITFNSCRREDFIFDKTCSYGVVF